MDQIFMEPIGRIHSPYAHPSEVPRQSQLATNINAYVEVVPSYQSGLKDLDAFSHAYLIFYFHQSQKISLQSVPPSDTKEHGIFAIRSPHRPNHIGLSLVSIQKITENRLYFTGLDMINDTPVLDIKPYIPQIDQLENASFGWLAPYHKRDDKKPD